MGRPVISQHFPSHRGRRYLGIVLVTVGLIMAITAALAWRAVRRGIRTASHDREVHVFPRADQPYNGPEYRVHFFDGTFRQLTDRDLWVALPALHGPPADAVLDQLARELAAEVESRDSQRCFRPRVVVLGTGGRTLREWTVAA